MANLYEARLDSETRDALPDKMFGLPKDRKYPLNDESHVVKAIQFFKYCPPANRAELAKNINKRAKALDMTITVNKESPFYKYADKRILKESIEPVINNRINVAECNFSIYTLDDLATIENACMTTLAESIELSTMKPYDVIDIMDMNDTLAEAYDGFIAYMQYCGEDVNTLHYQLTEDLKDIIIESMETDNSPIDECLDIIKESSNKYHSYRLVCEMIEHGNNLLRRCDEKDTVPIMITIKKLTDAKDSIYIDIMSGNIRLTGKLDPLEVSKMTPSVIDSLKDLQNELKNQLYIIDGDQPDNRKNITDSKLVEYEGLLVNADSDRLKTLTDGKYSCAYSDDVTPTHKMFLEHCNHVEGFTIIENICYASMKGGGLAIVCTEGYDSDDVCVIELTEELAMYMAHVSDDFSVRSLRGVRFSPYNNNIQTNISVTEAFSINSDGDIRIAISPKQSYMDSYAQNHKLLVENWRNNNYDAMKKNLAFAFAAISIIERSEEYKSRDPEVVKARAFYINDFKTYLKRIQSVEPEFDFVEYYRASDYDKLIINVPKTTIIGAKKLLKAIML